MIDIYRRHQYKPKHHRRGSRGQFWTIWGLVPRVRHDALAPSQEVKWRLVCDSIWTARRYISREFRKAFGTADDKVQTIWGAVKFKPPLFPMRPPELCVRD